MFTFSWLLVSCEVAEPSAETESEMTVPAPPVAADADSDGLSDEQEAKYGTDPQLPDSDGDTLFDGEEVLTYRTDPLSIDSDGDSYRDDHELLEGSDPTNEDSRIYTGGWPYNPNKDLFEDPGFPTSPVRPLRRFGRFWARDQHGEVVDFYDFAKQGGLVVIDGSAGGTWCGPCVTVSEWLSGKSERGDLEIRFGPIREAVNAGEIHWITVLIRGASPDAPSNSPVVTSWSQDYPNEAIPVLTDDGVIANAVNFDPLEQQLLVPSYALLDESLVVQFVGDTEGLLQAVMDRLDAE